MTKEEKNDEYIEALESELCASIERERRLMEDDLSIKNFAIKKMKSTRLYKDIISDPGSKAGKVVRAPRTFWRLIKNPEVRKSLMQKKTINDEYDEKFSGECFLEPWMLSLEYREKLVELALAEGKKIAIYFVERPDSSTFRYRCYNMLQATRASKGWQAVYFFKQEIEVAKKIILKSDVFILGRQSNLGNANEMIDFAINNDIEVGLDIDDLVFDMEYFEMMLDTINEKANRSYWLAYFMNVQTIARRMNFFITTNEFLAEKLEKSFGKPVKVIRNSLNREQIEASEVYSRKKKQNNGEFVIGYFSGSPTHQKDLEVAMPGVIKFLKNHDDAVLNIVGFMRFGKDVERLLESGKIRFIPFTDFRKLQRLVAEVDVNIAPLVVNDFTNSKSELKFFEAAAVETTTIASPAFAFSRAIKDGENGLIAKDNEWYEKLEFLYQNPEENRKMAKRAKKDALENYYGEKFLKEVEEAYGFFTREHESSASKNFA